jgi:hypothetical protein
METPRSVATRFICLGLWAAAQSASFVRFRQQTGSIGVQSSAQRASLAGTTGGR